LVRGLSGRDGGRLVTEDVSDQLQRLLLLDEFADAEPHRSIRAMV
jgi:hypothetical protein